MLLYGDTNSCLAVYAAKRRKIPVFHMEAGNRSFDQRVPEEINRKIVDHLSDINMVLTEHSRRYLEREGIRPETIVKTGSSLRELFDLSMPKIRASRVLDGLGLRPREYFVVSSHREEVVDDPAHLRSLLASLDALVGKHGFPAVFSVHPRTRKRLEALDAAPNPKIIFAKPFGFFDYTALQTQAYCTLSDSGTLTEEASLLGFPAVMLRSAHERPEGADAGTAIMAGYAPERVLAAVAMAVGQPPMKPVADYEAGNVAAKAARIILGYTDWVNEFVWRKKAGVQS
ncbi:UDP-N-acetyl glucosamine 2-epimerase [Alphaproteobacteria bacterium]|nr:UDP-N-acetyl glucosamine 2-epimerase [Alphaproteobacteria bacterium]